MKKFDLIVIGSGPAGEKGAVKAAYFGYKVALIEEDYKRMGGCQSSLSLKTFIEMANNGEEDILNKYLLLNDKIIEAHQRDVFENLKKHGVEVFEGKAEFINVNTLEINKKIQICSDYILISTGSTREHRFDVDYDGKSVFDEETIKQIKKIPSSVAIYGKTPTSIEIATMFIAMKIPCYFIMPQDVLSFIDEEIKRCLLKKINLFNQDITQIEKNKNHFVVHLEKGQIINAEVFVDASKRVGNIKELHLERVKINCNRESFIEVDANFRTNIPHIFAAGDVIGFPFLASHGMDQGRVAISRMFNTHDLEKIATIHPYVLYSIPELSCVGFNEEELKEKKIDYCVGRARHSDLIIGQIKGEKEGLLKLLFDPMGLKILGVHIIGKDASELIHYGMRIIEDEKNLYDVIGDIFNYPSFHELYKYAAYDGLGNLSGYKIKK